MKILFAIKNIDRPVISFPPEEKWSLYIGNIKDNLNYISSLPRQDYKTKDNWPKYKLKKL